MKAYKWFVILAILLFGSGFAVGVISVQIVEGSAPGDSHESSVEDRDRRHPKKVRGHRSPRDHKYRSHTNRRRSSSNFGPFVSSVRELAQKLELDADQQEALDKIVADATDQVARKEREIANDLLEVRETVEGLLTGEQRDRLDELLADQWAEIRSQRVASGVSWMRGELSLSVEALNDIEVILREYEESKGEYFRALRRGKEWPGRKEMEAEIVQLSEERDRRLTRWLDPEELTRFGAENCRRRSR